MPTKVGTPEWFLEAMEDTPRKLANFAGTGTMDIDVYLREIAEALAKVADWRETPVLDEEVRKHGVRTVEGKANNWHFVLVSFSIEDQGFPAGSRGYDGTARKDTARKDIVVLRLPREVVRRAFEMAEHALALAVGECERRRRPKAGGAT